MNTNPLNHLARLGVVALALAAASGVTGCRSTHSTRFHLAVADVDSPNPDVKFYRITIKGTSSNKKASLQTGYYNANAVRELFGEVTPKPASSGALPRVGAHSFRFDPATGSWVAVEDELLTVVFGADAKALAAEIELQAASNETGDQMGRLLAAAAGRGVFVEAVAAEKLTTKQQEAAVKVAASLKSNASAETLKDDDSADKVGNLLVQSAQDVLNALGSSIKLRADSAANGIADAEAALNALTPKKATP